MGCSRDVRQQWMSQTKGGFCALAVVEERCTNTSALWLISHGDGDASRDWLARLASSFFGCGGMYRLQQSSMWCQFCGKGRAQSTKHHMREWQLLGRIQAVRYIGSVFAEKGKGNHHTLFFGMVEETVHIHRGSTYFTSAFGHGAIRREKDETNGDRGTKKTQPIPSQSSSHHSSWPALNPSSSPWRTVAKHSGLTTALSVMPLRMRKATWWASTPSLFIPPTRVLHWLLTHCPAHYWVNSQQPLPTAFATRPRQAFSSFRTTSTRMGTWPMFLKMTKSGRTAVADDILATMGSDSYDGTYLAKLVKVIL